MRNYWEIYTQKKRKQQVVVTYIIIGKKERGDRYQVKLNFWNPTLTFDRHLTPVWTSRLVWIWTLRKNGDADQGWARRTGSITFIGLGSDDTFHLFLTNILHQTNLHHILPSLATRCRKILSPHAAIENFVVSLPFVGNESFPFLFFFFVTKTKRGYEFNRFEHVRCLVFSSTTW